MSNIKFRDVTSRLLLVVCCPLFFMTACRTYSRIERHIDETAAMRYARTGDLQAEIDKLASPLIEEQRTPGFVVGVLFPDGATICSGFGVTSRHDGHRPDGETLFAIGSTSKGFLSALAAVLVQENMLSWDQTLKSLLPEETPLSCDAGKITLQQLTTHSSGLPRHPFTLRFTGYFLQYLFTGSNFYRHLDRDYVLNYLARFKAPSKCNRYSNIAYGLLGHVLELRTGKNLETLMREKLLFPLQLDATGFDPSMLPGYNDRARPHAGDQPKFVCRGNPVPSWDYPDIMLGSAGLYSTAHDLLAYAHAHLQPPDRQPLHHALRDTLTKRPICSGGKRAPAWSVDHVDGHKITYQIGFTGGYSAYIGMDRLNKTAVVVLQNSLNWTESIGHRLLLLKAQAALLRREKDVE